jgi:hypothetical protein
MRRESLYPEGQDGVAFKRNGERLREILKIAKKDATIVIFILPPILLGELPGKKELKELPHDLKQTYPLEEYDFTSAISDHNLYSDHDHINIRGIKIFAETYLKPILPPYSHQENDEK